MPNKTYVLSYINEDWSNYDQLSNLILEDILRTLDQQTILEISDTNQAKNLKKRFGSKAFLDPDHLKYPILNAKTGEVDQGLLHAAYIDLRRKSGPGDLIQKARDMMQENIYLVEVNDRETISLEEFFELIS